MNLNWLSCRLEYEQPSSRQKSGVAGKLLPCLTCSVLKVMCADDTCSSFVCRSKAWHDRMPYVQNHARRNRNAAQLHPGCLLHCQPAPHLFRPEGHLR